jgi:hypothetical protein
MNITDILTKAERIEDQTLIGMVRVSRTVAALSRLIDAAKSTATGDQEIAVLGGLSAVAAKLLVIVGTR